MRMRLNYKGKSCCRVYREEVKEIIIDDIKVNKFVNFAIG